MQASKTTRRDPRISENQDNQPIQRGSKISDAAGQTLFTFWVVSVPQGLDCSRQLEGYARINRRD